MSTHMPKEKYLRAEKTTRNRDDYKVLLVGAIIGFFILVGQFTMTALNEQRWFRDVTAQTPFHSVALLRSVVNPMENSITVSGTLVKRRCEFQSLTGYITDDEGIRQRVFVNTRPEEIITGISGNRPPSDEAERWGPWLLTFVVDSGVKPVSWEIWAHHNCPNRPLIQSNIFAWGDWVTKIVDGNKIDYLHPPEVRELP